MNDITPPVKYPKLWIFNRWSKIAALDNSLALDKITSPSPFLIYYSNMASFEVLNRFHTVVLEPDFYTDVHALHNIPLAYLSIGEIHPTRAYFKEIRNENLLLGTHKVYDSHYVALKDDVWLNYLINTVVPDIVEKGFVGLMLDTVDSLLMHHSSTEVIDFINRLKQLFPDLYFMQNRGFDIMSETEVDAYLLESTLTNLDQSGNFVKIDPIDYKKGINKKYFSVDYWDLSDNERIGSIYLQAYALGYTPFVTCQHLTCLPDHSLETGDRLGLFGTVMEIAVE